MAATKKALVLSGGGGRGAYHIGVLEALVENGWMEDGKGPDIIPAFIRQPVYRWIARNRYKWFGTKEECMVPSPEIKSRFL